CFSVSHISTLSSYAASLSFSHSADRVRDLHASPTRRSSYLDHATERGCSAPRHAPGHPPARHGAGFPAGPASVFPPHSWRGVIRSEEHTSELQSRENLVCRLLLEKKK